MDRGVLSIDNSQWIMDKASLMFYETSFNKFLIFCVTEIENKNLYVII